MKNKVNFIIFVSRMTLPVITLLMLFCPGAYAAGEDGLFLSPAFLYLHSTEDVPGGDETEENFTSIDLRLGYIAAPIYVGGIYAMETKEISDVEIERTSYGVSLGFTRNGFMLLGHYFLSSEQDRGSGVKYTDGKGYQFDVAYHFSLSQNVILGPQVSYKKWQYDKIESGSVEVKESVNQSSLVPAVVFGLVF